MQYKSLLFCSRRLLIIFMHLPIDEWFFTNQNRTDGCPEPFAQTKRHGITVFGNPTDGHTEMNSSVEYSRPVHVQWYIFLLYKLVQLRLNKISDINKGTIIFEKKFKKFYYDEMCPEKAACIRPFCFANRRHNVVNAHCLYELQYPIEIIILIYSLIIIVEFLHTVPYPLLSSLSNSSTSIEKLLSSVYLVLLTDFLFTFVF